MTFTSECSKENVASTYANITYIEFVMQFDEEANKNSFMFKIIFH